MSDELTQFSHPQFWMAVVQIIWADLVLSGDNALLIAMACRRLPARQRRIGMILGAGLAACLLIAFTIAVSFLIALPYLRLIGACALLGIAVNLLGPDRQAAHESTEAAVSTAAGGAHHQDVADAASMGIDNAVAVAAIANGRYLLLGLGLAISIPIVVAGSAIVLRLIERFPLIVWIGGAVLGFVAGELLVSDPVIEENRAARRLASTASGANWPLGQSAAAICRSSGDCPPVELLFALSGALIVIGAGAVSRRRHFSRE